MLLRLEHVQSSTTSANLPADLTHVLTFRSVPQPQAPDAGPAMPGMIPSTATLQWPMTAADASKFTIGYDYQLDLTEFPPPSTPAVAKE